jgi:hypothetical protein
LLYILVYAALLVAEVLSRGSRALYYICLIGLFLFAGFRYEVGCDWSGYLNIFQLASNKVITLQTPEAAFWTANKLLHDFEFDYPSINVISSIFFFLGLNALAKRQPDPVGILTLAFPILILNLAMSGIRQAIAVGLFCFACNAFIESRLFCFILLVLIGSTFHSSVLFFLTLAPFVRGEYTTRRVALGALLALPGVYYFLTSATFEVYSQRYVGTGAEASGAPFRTGLLALTGIAFLWFLDDKWKASFIQDYKLVKICSVMMILTVPLAVYSSVMGDRVGYYLIPAQLMILTRLPLLVRGRYAAQIAFAPYAAAALFLATWVNLSGLFEQCYGSYQTWL